MNKPLIELNNIIKTFKGRTVLDIPHFTFEQGVSYALVGANGSGKSTLLRLIADIIKPTEGEIIKHELGENQDIAYLPQKPYAFSFSVIRNITMAIPNKNKAEKRALAHNILEEVGIAELASSYGNKLSGGEAQRLSLARLIVQPHKLLLLDEPTSATDISANERIEQAITHYKNANNTSLIFATHALSQAERLADKILFFSDGKIIEVQSAQELLQNPQTKECKEFLRFWQY